MLRSFHLSVSKKSEIKNVNKFFTSPLGVVHLLRKKQIFRYPPSDQFSYFLSDQKNSI